MKKYNKSYVITHEVLLAIDLVDVLRAIPLDDHHEGDVIVINYVNFHLLLLLKLIIKRNLLSYFLLLVRTFLLRRMFN
jgi:hypothetical protein